MSQHTRTRARSDALLGHRTDFISLNTPKSRHLLSNPAIKSTLIRITGQNVTRSEWRSLCLLHASAPSVFGVSSFRFLSVDSHLNHQLLICLQGGESQTYFYF